MNSIKDAVFERLLRRMDEESFHGYRFQYPPILAWPALRRPAALLQAWRRAAGAVTPSQLYVNFPYCKTRCTFCFLPVAVSSAPSDFDAYLDALESERRLWREAVAGHRFSSLYIGGGTPSLLGDSQLNRLFEGIRSDFKLLPGAQVAVEANPAFADAVKMRTLKKWGVDWLSLGVQSLHPDVIARVDRWQDNPSVFNAYQAARAAGIRCINIDLLCGVEGQTRESFLFDVKTVARLRPDQVHLNFFEDSKLTLFRQRGGRLTADAVARARETHRLGRDILLSAGYLDIDDESFSLDLSAQNLQASVQRIDEGHPTLGLGSGAVSYLPGGYRHINRANVGAYQRAAFANALPVFRAVKLDMDMEMANYALNRLLFGTTQSGELSRRDIVTRFKRPPTPRIAAALEGLLKDGFLRRTAGGRFSPNPDIEEAEFRIKQSLMSTPLMRRAAKSA